MRGLTAEEIAVQKKIKEILDKNTKKYFEKY